MFIVLVQYEKPLADVEAVMTEHRSFVDRGYAQGVFLASGPQVPRTGGLILAGGVSRAELETLLAEDPFLAAGVASHQVIEFTPRKSDPRWAALFSPSE